MRTNNGFITLHREILSWEYFKDANTFRVFIFLLLSANFVDGESRGRKIKRGELITSSAEIAEALGLTQKQVSTALKHLIDAGEIERKTSPRNSLISIKKYCAYQTRANTFDKIGQTESEKRANKMSNGQEPENTDISRVSDDEDFQEGKQNVKQNAKKGQTKSEEKGKQYNNKNNIYNKNVYNNNARAHTRETAHNPKIHNFPEREYDFEELTKTLRKEF